MLVDSGAGVNVMKPGIITSEVRAIQTAARRITGTKLKIMGSSGDYI
jgi:hypothetical protein